MTGHIQNLKPWPKGVSGNPGGRPKKKLITDELERLLEQEAPDAPGKTWAALIAEALLGQARRGDVRAIAELTNRMEGKSLQPVELGAGTNLDLVADTLAKARKRVHQSEVGYMSEAELRSSIRRLEEELGSRG